MPPNLGNQDRFQQPLIQFVRIHDVYSPIFPKKVITAINLSRHTDIMRIWEASVLATHHFLKPADFQLIRDLLQDSFPESVDLYGFFDEAGDMQAFMGIEDRKIEMLFIATAMRGKGIGRQMMHYAMQQCNAIKVDVNEENQQALAFYRHMGFEVKGRSATDGMGKPYPLLHLELPGTDSANH